MTPEERIVSMCLFGFIRRESRDEQKRCLESIKSSYGFRIANIVRRYLG
ncbi:hypothetical protein ACFL20_09310 [Spirochaetota bacterium]